MKASLKLAVSMLLLSTTNVYSQVPKLEADAEDLMNSVYRNAVGLEVINRNGEKTNYTFEQTQSAYLKSLSSSTLNFEPETKITASLSKSVEDISFEKKHQLYTYGVGIGAFGMEKIDVDADGIYEIVMGNANGWSVQQHQVSTNSYQLIHHTPNRESYSEKLVKLLVTHHERNGRPLIVTVYKDGLVEIFKGTNFELYRTFNADMNGVNDLTINDANNDGKRDLVIVSDSETKVFDFDSFIEQLKIGEGAESVRVGQVNNDDYVELVLSTGVVYQAIENSYSELWRSATEFGDWIELGNIDGDNQLEIIGVDSWSHYRATDVIEQAIVWEEDNFDTNVFRLVDVTGDDIPEIVLGDGQWGNVHAHDIKTRELVWSISNPEHGVTNVLVFDGDNDSNLEVFWGAGYTSSGGDYLFAYDLTHQEREWQSLDVSGPFAATAMGDLDHDGKLELVFASWESDSGYEDGLIYIVDAKSFQIKHITDGNFFDRLTWTGIHDIAIENVDDDAQLEILVTTGRVYNGALYVIDGKSYEKENEVVLDSGSVLYAIETYDVDDDGMPEIITGAGKEHSGSPGTFVYAINVDDATTQWISPAITFGWTDTTDIHVADTDADAEVEILAVNENITVLNRNSGLAHHLINGDFKAVATVQHDSDAALEILAAKGNGKIDVIDGASYQLEETINLCSGEINAVYALNDTHILATCGSEVMSYDLQSGLVEWSDDTQDSGLGEFNNIVSQVINGKQVFLVGGDNGVYVYKETPPQSVRVNNQRQF